MSPKKVIRRFVAYYRVSTDRQGKSGLGLEAQKAAVLNYLNGGDWQLVSEFTEIESGKKHDNRPELAKAIETCRRQKAKLIIAKLDRLSRNLAFTAALMDTGVEFVAADNPHANKLTIHILAAVAQHEREMISERTKAALQAATARGTRLGNPRLAQAAKLGRAAVAATADRFAASVMPHIQMARKAGATSNNAIAGELNKRNIPTAFGRGWTHVQVGKVLARAS